MTIVNHEERPSKKWACSGGYDVALDVGNFFVRVITLPLRAVGVLHTLRINDQEAGHGEFLLLPWWRRPVRTTYTTPTIRAVQ
jgi:hypothetical protein